MKISLDWQAEMSTTGLQFIESEVSDLPLVSDHESVTETLIRIKFANVPGPRSVRREEFDVSQWITNAFRCVKFRELSGHISWHVVIGRIERFHE